MKNRNHFQFKAKGVPAIIVFAVLVGVVGLTIAWSHDGSVMTNQFNLAAYKTLYTENFDAPTNWITCQTIDKTLTVTNDSSSSGPVAVRVRLEEQWLDSRDREMPLVSANSGLTMAQINFTENSGWVKDGLYYYYENDLAPGETTTSLISGVTLNCDANLDADTGADKSYAGQRYNLKMVAQTVEAEHKNAKTGLSSMIAAKSKQCDPDWSRGAKVSDDPSVSNCNGVNQYTEKGQTVSYYRGEVPDNNVVWAGFCWKMVRTTYSGGVKLAYYGTPTDVNGAQQCPSGFSRPVISGSYTVYHGTYNSTAFPINYYEQGHSGEYTFADLGYMHGEKVFAQSHTIVDNASYAFSKAVTRSGNTYTLDTSEGNYIAGLYNDIRSNIWSGKFFYFCTNAETSCDSSEIGYYVGSGGNDYFKYYPLSGYDDIDGLKEASNENIYDSIAKTVIETWFVNSGLNAHEDELEDAIFCNDRTLATTHLNSPSLDCPMKRDAFTKNDTTNGNGALGYKVGLLTADEYTMVGMRNGYYDTTYLAGGGYDWTMTPNSLGFQRTDYHVVGTSYMFTRAIANDVSSFRPSVSLKAGAKVGVKGEGTAQNPYIIEF